MKQSKFKKYSFWIGVFSAVVLCIEALANAFGFYVSTDALVGVGNAILSVLVVLGIVVKDTPNQDDTPSDDDKNIKNM